MLRRSASHRGKQDVAKLEAYIVGRVIDKICTIVKPHFNALSVAVLNDFSFSSIGLQIWLTRLNVDSLGYFASKLDTFDTRQ